jgi:hypothetical protein
MIGRVEQKAMSHQDGSTGKARNVDIQSGIDKLFTAF